MALAQQDAQYTQYMYNTMSVNPAYAGSRGQLSLAALYRSQWVGLEGAPKTFTLNLHSPIRDSRVGYGISVVNDNIGDGVVQETYIDAVVSYTIDVSRDAKLSFGLKAGGNMLSIATNASILVLQPWLVWPPAILIVVTSLAFNLLGDGLRDALDPRTLKQ